MVARKGLLDVRESCGESDGLKAVAGSTAGNNNLTGLCAAAYSELTAWLVMCACACSTLDTQ